MSRKRNTIPPKQKHLKSFLASKIHFSMNVTLLKNNCQKRFKALHFSVGSENNQLMMMMMLTKLANLMIDNLDLQIQQKGQYIYAR